MNRIIKLDLDNISFDRLMKTIEQIKQYTAFKEIHVSASPRLDGYHVRIQTFWKLKDMAIYQYRFQFGDDTKRLCKDMLTDNPKIRDILYNKKIKYIKDKKYVFEEVKMFKYVKKTPESEWQKIQSPKSIKSFKLESLQLQLS